MPAYRNPFTYTLQCFLAGWRYKGDQASKEKIIIYTISIKFFFKHV